MTSDTSDKFQVSIEQRLIQQQQEAHLSQSLPYSYRAEKINFQVYTAGLQFSRFGTLIKRQK